MHHWNWSLPNDNPLFGISFLRAAWNHPMDRMLVEGWTGCAKGLFDLLTDSFLLRWFVFNVSGYNNEWANCLTNEYGNTQGEQWFFDWVVSIFYLSCLLQSLSLLPLLRLHFYLVRSEQHCFHCCSGFDHFPSSRILSEILCLVLHLTELDLVRLWACYLSGRFISPMTE